MLYEMWISKVYFQFHGVKAHQTAMMSNMRKVRNYL